MCSMCKENKVLMNFERERGREREVLLVITYCLNWYIRGMKV